MKKIAYIMSRFPHLPETFILREMIELERFDWEVVLYPLIVQDQALLHEDAQAWMTRVRRSRWMSGGILVANLKRVVKQPIRYVSTFLRMVWESLTSPKYLLRSLLLFPKIVYMAQEMQADQITRIHAHYATYPALAAWIIYQFTEIPYSITVHAHDIYVDRSMLASKVRDAAFVVAISEFNRRFLGEHLGDWAIQKTHVIHCGIQPEWYTPNQAAKNNRRFEIVSIGSLQPYKGQRYLIEACQLLRQQGIDFHCRVIGDGQLRSELQHLIDNKDLKDHVELTGSIPQESIAKILPQADCYIQPSIITPSGKMEGIPVSLMEAMASGLPVVATDISGISELVRDGQTGWLCPPENPQALVDAIRTIYTDRHSAEETALAGQELVINEFNLHQNVKQLSALFQIAHT
jgi:glycosyltransferase involved in cell wall biosynthesis